MAEQLESLQAQQNRLQQQIEALQRTLADARTVQAETNTSISSAAQVGVAASSVTGLASAPAPTSSSSPSQLASSGPAAPVNPAGGSAPGATPNPTPARLTFNGDVRLRYESNTGDEDARDRGRGVLRARVRAAYAVNDWLSVGGQLATGDPDDPNSADITLSNFDDDLTVSLDQVYARLTYGNVQMVGGKIPQPLVRTELVWDGDVAPEGIGASWRAPLAGGSLRATALYFLVDEVTAGPDSDMIGGQIGWESNPARPIRAELAVSYLDYSLRSTANGDAGDFRTNRFANGRYLSDFNLFDVVGAVTYTGMGEPWPVRAVADYVHNFGATVSEDSGFGIDLLVGRIAERQDLRFGYGYAQTGVDAVLAAFSQDNTNIATNYLQHSLSVDYVPVRNVVLNATYYRYRPKSRLYAGANDPFDWLDRLRLNFLINF